MSKLVSIIILVYNNIQYLEKAFKSAVGQSYENIQIIISDDCSKDVSEKQIQDIVSNCQGNRNVSINVNKHNMGTVKNFNNAIKSCQGDIIVPLACDDEFIDNHVIAKIVSHFERTKCDICTSLRKGRDSATILPEEKDRQILKKKDKQLLFDRLAVDNFISGSTICYSRNVFAKYGFFDEKYTLLEDYPYVFNLARLGVEISLLDMVTIIYGEEGVSNPKNRKKINSKVQKDLDTLLVEDIGSSIMLISNRKCKRVVEYNINKKTKKSFIIYFKYLDVILIKILKKIKKNKKSIFWMLYNDIEER